MPDDELIDKAIDEAIARTEKTDDEVKKRRPKPFRYLTQEEIKEILDQDSLERMSVMKPPEAPKIVAENVFILGMGDIDAIESIVQRHEASRKFKEKQL